MILSSMRLLVQFGISILKSHNGMLTLFVHEGMLLNCEL